MSKNTQDSGRRALGDLTNVLGKRPASFDLEKNAGGLKISRVDKVVEPRKESDENAKATGGVSGNFTGNLFDGVGKQNFAATSIFHDAKVQHMAAEAAGLLSKQDGDVRNHGISLDSSGLNDKEDSSLESESGCEEEDGDDIDSALLPYARETSKIATNDKVNEGECLTQEEMGVSSGNQNPQSSFDFTAGDVPCTNAQHPSMGDGLLAESGVATKSCACSFCLKAAFMWADLHYQDARSRLGALKKSIKLARSLGAKSHGNEYPFNAGGYNSKRAAEMGFELSQQQRSLFLHTENVLLRESAQLHSGVVKLKDLRDDCKTDLNI
ncbi:uncharacterized protein LOC100826138 [Brachypodium distachyon]|uniref:Uncharacterized protein n=1 Tax=Brachypodium distachyon TaxID=15368 RepID=I1IF58_BRADI|nr:uncharacterized protein LOC100826138 [Brachypodium distachyon]XP_024318285.1 uncharacterized protein LOC100826138 [Brachypodium distachyon]KQK01875.1 hypothetical protein BRADI_3g59010v3 [Brachypodium distachyon]PNT69617.1 hypothetical protein BRADI_3g59010v3 [Brachypodium distachyon]PNT69618.1 hypothetical protein BRADI_3g59010v3 [Brachypodium distachyon]|eukprot:XP_003570629.1 uncharacterized protein LOC100826138 [Brachypodium distachyon]